MEDWRNADLQVDVGGADLSDEDRVRICVADVGIREMALGAGLVAFPGLPPADRVQVTVDALDDTLRSGRVGPVVFQDGATYVAEDWVPCAPDTDDCTACSAGGSLAAEDEDAWLLAVRFR